MKTMPAWKTPKNIAEALDDGDGIWEDDRWSPILLTAMSGTEYQGREIPVSWQIEFSPEDDELESANAILERGGLDPDGYGWGEYILKAVQTSDADLGTRLHLSDCETETCVIWVESEADCRVLIETVWRLVHPA